MTVVAEGGRIAAAGPRAEVALPSGARLIDGAGRWPIPGLIDFHVHLSRSASLYSAPAELDLRACRDWASEELPATRAALPATFARYLASAVTGVIDRGGPLWTLDLRALAARGAAARERVAMLAAAGVDLVKIHFVPTLADDPARDIRNTRRIALVVRGGKPYLPDSLMAPCVR